jgi:hypothetical protein
MSSDAHRPRNELLIVALLRSHDFFSSIEEAQRGRLSLEDPHRERDEMLGSLFSVVW